MKTTRINFLVFCFASLGYINLYSQNNNSLKYPQNDSGIYTSSMIQVQPKFPGDIKKYLADSIRYPDEARKKNIQGTVYVSFIVEREGSISTVKVLRSDNEILNNEALRLISSMPKWRPGKENGVPQRIRYFIPIVFKL